MSGVWVRCPNCDLEVKVEFCLVVTDRDVQIDPDYRELRDHARNCVEENG